MFQRNKVEDLKRGNEFYACLEKFDSRKICNFFLVLSNKKRGGEFLSPYPNFEIFAYPYLDFETITMGFSNVTIDITESSNDKPNSSNTVASL